MTTSPPDRPAMDPREPMSRRRRMLLRVLLGIAVIPGLLASSCTVFVGFQVVSAIRGQEVERIASPDGKLELVVTEYDHGALGGEVVVSVERTGLNMWSRVLATAAWGDRPVVWWVTNETAFAGEGEMNVFTGRVQDLRGPSY